MNSEKHRDDFNIWPSFVDIMASLLMIIIFILVLLLIMHHFVQDTLKGVDRQKNSLTQEVCELKHAKEKAQQENAALSLEISDFRKRFDSLAQQLQQQITVYEIQLSQEKQAAADTEQKLNDITMAVQEENAKLKSQLAKIEALQTFNAQFSLQLKHAVDHIKNVQVIDDRFIFQAEIFFDVASDQIGIEGQKQLDRLAKILHTISKTMPDNIKWTLRVDGHTDRLPIKTSQFPSNLELSIARAISVVKYLIKKGVKPENLLPTGFGDNFPLKGTEKQRECPQNRRIEFRLDSVLRS